MIKKIFIIAVLSVLYVAVLPAQSLKEAIKKQPQGIIYNTEMSGLFRFHTNGFALGFNYGQLKTYYRTTTWQVELVHLKHPQEYLDRIQFNPARPGSNGTSFTFGKQNSFFALNGGYGQKYYFSGKAKKQGVAVGMSYSFGPTLGFIKPYYLELYRTDNRNATVIESYSEENASSFLDRNDIVGGGGFGYGFGDISLAFGGQAKAALHLDWGAFEEFIRAVEVGIMINVYNKSIPIMLEADNRPYFINLYFSAELGKRK